MSVTIRCPPLKGRGHKDGCLMSPFDVQAAAAASLQAKLCKADWKLCMHEWGCGLWWVLLESERARSSFLAEA